MNLKNDIVFKIFFGKKGNEKYLIDFLEAVLNTKIEKIEVLQEVTLQQIIKDGKVGRIDIKATIDDEKIVNIEMQIEDEHNMKKRSTYYGSRLMSEQLKKGEEYKEIKPVILINILGYNLLEVPEYHTKTVTVAEKHRDYEVIDEITYHFIELPKFRKSKPDLANKLECWLALIDSRDGGLIEMAKEKSKIIEEADKEVEEILSDEAIREINYYHEKWERDEADVKAYAFSKGETKGRKLGRTEGEAIGEEKGRTAEKIEIAKEMKKKGIDVETIAEITKLSKEEILKL